MYQSALANYDLMERREVPLHVYQDITIINNNLNNEAVAIKFNETRAQPILDDPDQYCVSFARFNISTASLPVFIPLVQTNQNNSVNRTVYSFTMTYKDYVFQSYVIWIPQNKTATVPSLPVTTQDLSTDYYYCMSYNYWIQLCNKALTQCFNGLKVLVEDDSDNLPTENIPFILFDNTADTCSFQFDKLGFADTLSEPINVYMNQPMFNLFQSFDFENYGVDSTGYGKNYRLIIQNENDTNIWSFDTYDAIQIYQQESCTITWSPVQSIVIASNTLPCSSFTIQSVPQIYGSKTTMNYSQGNNITIPIISDFQVSNTREFKPSIEMSPYFPRYIDLEGHTEIKNISIDVYWKDNYNNFRPLFLNSGCTCNFKLCYTHKSVVEK